MKKLFFMFLSLNLSFISFSQIRNCGTMQYLEYLKSEDPALEQRMEKNEINIQQWIQNAPEVSSSAIITIPVVVHVVYYTSTENISTAQVQSQIDILNEDFRRLNADASNTPSAFQSIAADSEIEFCLATIDPNGNSTTGITRTSTSQSSFSTNDNVKYSSSGGIDAWNTAEYLNIWVCDLSGGLLGYAQFPGGNSSEDGVVCDVAYFGNIGTATSPFELGRTTTHEVGHWLNLRHIWGDANCGDDYCNDTPTQQSSNSGCPSFPSTSNCSANGSNGDMFMNYMDYTYDACMNLFTQDQKTRMIAAINTSRSGLLSSNGCQGSGYGCTNSTAYNYDPNATIDDGSCCYISGCTDVLSVNYNSTACYDDGSCIASILGCTNPNSSNFDPNANTTLSLGGALDNTIGTGGYFNGDQYLNFDSYKQCIIRSAMIYSQSINTITFELRDNGGNVIDDTTLSVIAGQQRINLNFDVPIANDMQLGVSNGALSNIGLYRNNAGPSYPYNIASAINITNSSATTNPYGYYYFYYDIEVEVPCLNVTIPSSWDCGAQGVCSDPGTGNGQYATLSACQLNCIITVYGCTNPIAYNYDPNATIDDGSCCYIGGCTDPTATNYNSLACLDDGSCVFPVAGCTDSTATNYNPLATTDDGSCCYGDQLVITITTDNYPLETSWQLVNQSGSVVQSINAGNLTQSGTSYTWNICLSSTDCYDFTIYDTYGDGICCTHGNGSYSVSYNGIVVASGGSFNSSETTSSIGSCITSVIGCMNSNATNYNPTANTGTAFGGIIDPNVGTGSYFTANQYLVLDCIQESKIVSAVVYTQSSNTITFELRDNVGSVIDDTTLLLIVGGQRIDLNFNVPIGTDYQLGVSAIGSGLWRNDGGVNYPYDIGGLVNIKYSSASSNPYGFYYFFYDIEVEARCILPINIYGCTDSTSTNYNPNATVDDGSCISCIYGCTDSTSFNYNISATCDDGSCILVLYGCIDPTAVNYYPSANTDDGSCLFYGCTDPTASNYNATAIVGCDANGSTSCCTYLANCGPVTGVNLTDIIHDRVRFNWDNMNSSTCDVDQIRFRYRAIGTTSYSTKTMGVPVGSGCNTSNTSKLVLGLTANTTYEYDFKIWYCNASIVNWHAGGTFTTAPDCNNVINIVPTPITTTKTQFCWDTISTYAFVRLQYRENVPGSSFSNIGGMGVYSPILCKDKNGLTPGLTYRVMWRTWCNPNGGPYRSPQWDGPVTWTQPTSIRISDSNENSLLKVVDILGREVNPSKVIDNTTLFYIYNDGTVEKKIIIE